MEQTIEGNAMRSIVVYLYLMAIICAVLYGVSYQQLRHFDVSDPRGASDSISYIKMSHGDYDVSRVHKYRVVVPLLARGLRSLLGGSILSEDKADVRSFYAVNFVFVALCAMALFQLMCRLGFGIYLAAFGTLIFLTSRETVMATGTPLVDSFFIFSVAVTALLTLKGKIGFLSIILPFLFLSKETFYPVAFLPLMTRKARSFTYAASIVVSFAVVYLVRHYVDSLSNETASVATGFYVMVQHHLGTLSQNALRIFGPEGLRDFQSGYSIFILFALLGAFVNRKRHLYGIPVFLIVLIPLSIFYAFLSGNLGRIFFDSSFPVMIPYALIFIREMNDRYGSYMVERFAG
jgi:hypothetical protein